MAGIVVAVALAVMGLAFWHGYPGVAALWLGLVVAAWTYPPAQYTGKKDSRGYPTPAHDGERAAMTKYRFWDDLRFRIVVPSGDALPGWPLLYSWFAAVLAASAVYHLPVTDPYSQGYGPLVNAVATFMILTTVNGARRRTATEGDVNPGVRLNTTLTMAAKNPAGTAALGFGGIILGVGLAVAAEVFRPVWVGFVDIPTSALFPLLGGGGLLLTLGLRARHEALAKWELIVAARAEWGPRWMMLKMDPAPRLVDRVMVEQATVDTFEAPGSMGAMAFWQMAPKITPTIGAGMEVHTLDVPDQDGQGQPIEGSRHPLRFDVASWPAGSMPNPSDPSVPEDLITLQARVALAIACDEGSLSPRYIFAGVQRLTTAAPSGPREPESVEGQIVPWSDPNGEAEADDADGELSPAVWALLWHHPDGASARDFRVRCTGAFAGAVGAATVVDHRAENGNGVLYYGAIGDSRTEFTPGTGVDAEALRRLEGEDQWDSRWSSASSKIGPNAPIVQWDTEESANLADGTTINRIAFVSRQGVTVEQLFEPESHFPSVLQAAPFVALTGYPGQGRRLGDRHPMAVAIQWSPHPVPDSPDKLAPVPGSSAPEWVLAGRLNEAFKAAKLSRPELAKATCLTERRSGGHIWKLEVRLYGGNTLADVRTAARRIQGAWSSEWLRVSEAPDGCIIVAGANPRRVKLANPKRDELYLESLNWAQVFLDSGLTGIGGKMPALRSVGHLPRNEQVQVLDFDIAGTGLDFTSFTGARPKLESNSANSFVEPRRVKNSATEVRILASEVNPMPERAGYDWDHIDESSFIPFATGVEGEPVEYNFKVDPHLLIAGASGGGKSVLLQSLIYGAVVRGYELFVADPTKGGADFKFAEPYARGFTATPFEAAAMMKGIYAEVLKRKEANSRHAVGNYRDLPEDIRPKHMIIVIDEFTSLMGGDPVPAASDNPEMDEERESILATNRAKQEIGVYTGKIAREARSAGVTLFLATQKLSAKMLDTIPGAGDLKVNLSRLLLGKATYGDKQSALRAPQDAPDLGDSIPPGRGLFETTAGAAMAIQSWYDPAEQTVLAQKLAYRESPLEESEKLDIGKYMPKDQSQPALEQKKEQVVDLGEMEIDLGELDLGELDLADFVLEDDEDSASDTGMEGTPQRVEPATLPDDAEGVIFLDVDGALAPFQPTDTTVSLSISMTGAIVIEPEILAALADTGLPVLWATDREDEASEHLTHLVPSATGHLTYCGDTHGWWKIDAAEAWIREHPSIRRIVWLDDMLEDEDVILGVPYSDTARDVFRAAGVELLAITPDPNEGLSVAQVERAAAWLREGHPVPAPEPVDEMTIAGLELEPVAPRPRRNSKPVPQPIDELDFELEGVPDPAPEPVAPPRPTRPPRPKAAPITAREEPVEDPEPEFNLGVRPGRKPVAATKPQTPNRPATMPDEDLFEAPPKPRIAFDDEDIFA